MLGVPINPTRCRCGAQGVWRMSYRRPTSMRANGTTNVVYACHKDVDREAARILDQPVGFLMVTRIGDDDE